MKGNEWHPQSLPAFRTPKPWLIYSYDDKLDSLIFGPGTWYYLAQMVMREFLHTAPPIVAFHIQAWSHEAFIARIVVGPFAWVIPTTYHHALLRTIAKYQPSDTTCHAYEIVRRGEHILLSPPVST